MPEVRKQRLCARDAEHDPPERLPAGGAMVHEPDDDPVRAKALEDGRAKDAHVVGPDAKDAPEGMCQGEGGKGEATDENGAKDRGKVLSRKEGHTSEGSSLPLWV